VCDVLRLAGAFFGFRPPPPVVEADLEAPGPALTARELEVLRLVAQGLSDATIAEQLVLSAHTVHRHMANIRTRLRQRSRAAVVAQAARSGLI
jgi:DNA-binding NarL/FixJ family response regulator